MDIKAKAEELVNKIKNDKTLLANFKAEPVKTIEGLIGVDLPDEQVQKIADLVKTKLNLDDAAGVVGKIKGLFSKK